MTVFFTSKAALRPAPWAGHDPAGVRRMRTLRASSNIRDLIALVKGGKRALRRNNRKWVLI